MILSDKQVIRGFVKSCGVMFSGTIKYMVRTRDDFLPCPAKDGAEFLRENQTRVNNFIDALVYEIRADLKRAVQNMTDACSKCLTNKKVLKSQPCTD